jgi:sulfur carrier protein ThiS
MTETELIVERKTFTEFRFKIHQYKLRSATTGELLQSLRFSGRLSVVVKNGCIVKSGYEEGYFSRKQQERLILWGPVGQAHATRSFGTALIAQSPDASCRQSVPNGPT